jgi:hypothetical protein
VSKSLKIRSKKEIAKEVKFRRRKEIEDAFINNENVILRIPLSEAIIHNQQLILETLLDIRDGLKTKS